MFALLSSTLSMNYVASRECIIQLSLNVSKTSSLSRVYGAKDSFFLPFLIGIKDSFRVLGYESDRAQYIKAFVISNKRGKCHELSIFSRAMIKFFSIFLCVTYRRSGI